MNRSLFLLAGFLTVLTAQAQNIFTHSEQAWLYTDTAKDERALIGRHSLLLVHWNVNSEGLERISNKLKGLSKQAPFMSMVAEHHARFAEELDSSYVKRVAELNQFKLPMRVDTRLRADEVLNLSTIKCSYYHPDGTLLLNNAELNEETISTIQKENNTLQSSYSGPGKTLSTSSLYSRAKQVNDLSLFTHPQGLAFDGRYRQIIVSDTHNHRVVILDESGEVQHVIGDGTPGQGIGEFMSSNLNNPKHLITHPDSNFTLLNDAGNTRFVKLNMLEFKTSELLLKDADGIEAYPATPASHMSLYHDSLILCHPEENKVIIMNIHTGTVLEEIGATEPSDGIAKKRGKLYLESPSLACTDGEALYIYDNAHASLLQLDGNRINVIWTKDEQLAEETEAILDTSQIQPSDLFFLDNDLIISDRKTGYSYTIESDLRKVYDHEDWNVADSEHLNSILTNGRDVYYTLDSYNGSLWEYSENGASALQLSNIKRLTFPAPNSQSLIVGETVQVSRLGQTNVDIKLELPEGYILHPMHPGRFFASGRTEAYLENDDPYQGPIKLITFKDFSRTQINLLGEVTIMPIGEPWRVLRMTTQLSIPVNRSDEVPTDQVSRVNLLQGFSGVD